jgi:hypothetical protein
MGGYDDPRLQRAKAHRQVPPLVRWMLAQRVEKLGLAVAA